MKILMAVTKDNTKVCETVSNSDSGEPRPPAWRGASAIAPAPVRYKPGLLCMMPPSANTVVAVM